MGALHKDHLLVPALGTELGIGAERTPALGAGKGNLRSPSWFGGRKVLSEHGGHHDAHAHAHAGTGASLGGRCFFHGHGRFHLHELVHVLEDPHAGTIVDCLLNLGGRGDGIDVELAETQAEVAEVFFEPAAEAL